jgi:hypothetical protein
MNLRLRLSHSKFSGSTSCPYFFPQKTISGKLYPFSSFFHSRPDDSVLGRNSAATHVFSYSFPYCLSSVHIIYQSLRLLLYLFHQLVSYMEGMNIHECCAIKTANVDIPPNDVAMTILLWPTININLWYQRKLSTTSMTS